MQLDFTACDRPPRPLRELYFQTLPEPQVHYVEQRVTLAKSLLIGPSDAPAGYMAIHDSAVVEFFVADSLLPWLSETFYAAAAHGGASSAVVKSYDQLALVAASGRPARIATVGVNCTAWSDEWFEPPTGFASRRGHSGDSAMITAIGPGLFERPDEISLHLETGQILIYELDGEPVGCGIASPVREGADAFDIGVGVLPACRQRGMGEQIIRHLKLYCLRELGVRPTCGCAVENVASRRTLEKAGFLSRHRLLQIDWAP